MRASTASQYPSGNSIVVGLAQNLLPSGMLKESLQQESAKTERTVSTFGNFITSSKSTPQLFRYFDYDTFGEGKAGATP